MLKITYQTSNGTREQEATFKDEKEFVALQLREVPALQDFLMMTSVTLDGQPIAELSGKRIEEAFLYFNK